jgi:hypothetical protein
MIAVAFGLGLWFGFLAFWFAIWLQLPGEQWPEATPIPGGETFGHQSFQFCNQEKGESR